MQPQKPDLGSDDCLADVQILLLCYCACLVENCLRRGSCWVQQGTDQPRFQQCIVQLRTMRHIVTLAQHPTKVNGVFAVCHICHMEL